LLSFLGAKGTKAIRDAAMLITRTGIIRTTYAHTDVLSLYKKTPSDSMAPLISLLNLLKLYTDILLDEPDLMKILFKDILSNHIKRY